MFIQIMNNLDLRSNLQISESHRHVYCMLVV